MSRTFLLPSVIVIVSAVALSGCGTRTSQSFGDKATARNVEAQTLSEGYDAASGEDMSAPGDGDYAPADMPAASPSSTTSEPAGLGGYHAEGASGPPVEAATSPAREPAAKPAADRSRAIDGREASIDEAMPGPDDSGGGSTRRNQSIQSGTLTAGSFDDNERFDSFQEFLSETMQNDIGESYPRFAIGQRVVIDVRSSQGRPVGDARVVISAADQNGQAPPLLELMTASDGQVLFLTGLDGARGAQEFQVSVYPPDNSQPVTQTLRADQSPWQVTLSDVAAAAPKQLDLALVIDTTGSMGDELEYLKVEIDSIAETVHKMFPNVDQRYSLIVYRDEGDQYVSRTFDFTGDLQEFRGKLSAQSANGGGDYPEAMHLALEHAGKLSWRDRDTARVLFLVADAPPHDELAGRTLDAAKELRRQGVRIFPVASSGVQRKAEYIMRAMSFMTVGQYLFLTDHSGVGNPHAKPHVPEYTVERLDRLMIRMIASELAGKRLAPQEVIAIERGEAPEKFLDQQSQEQNEQPIIEGFFCGTIDTPSSTWPRLETLFLLAPWAILCVAVCGLIGFALIRQTIRLSVAHMSIPNDRWHNDAARFVYAKAHSRMPQKPMA